MASLVEQIYAQADAGSAQGQGFGQYYLQGKEQGQNQQRIDVAKQQLAMQIAQAPLRQTLMQQEAQLNQFKLTSYLEQRQAQVQNEDVFSQLTSLVGQRLASEDPVGAKEAILEARGRNKGLWQHPGMAQLMKDADAGIESKLALQKLRNEARAMNAYTPSIVSVTDPLTGEQHSAFKSSDRSAQLIKEPTSVTPEITQLTDPVTGKPVSVLRTGPNSFRETRGEGEVIEFESPSGEKTTIRRGGGGAAGAGGTTAAMTSKAEQSIAGAVSAAKLGTTLIKRLRPEDVGVLGRGGEIVVDQGLAQAIPGLANLKRVNTRTLLRFYRNDFTRSLKLDSQMTDEERKRVEAMLPSEGAMESLPAALEKIKAASREAAERARFGAQRAGRPLPLELLLPAELWAKVQAGELTPKQAAAIAAESPFADEFDTFTPPR